MNKGVLPALELPVEFEADRIELDIPMDGITIKGGWKIFPLMPPVVNEHDLAFLSLCTYVVFIFLNIDYKEICR